MGYSLYRLEFTTGLHVGTDRGGSSLGDGRMTIHSDTFFSALCCERTKFGDINRLYDFFSSGALVISDTLPYKGEEYFLPKPVLHTRNSKGEGNHKLKKTLRSIEFIPLSVFDKYLKGYSDEELEVECLNQYFGGLVTDTKVSIKHHPEPMPYHVAYWRFPEDTGLYIIVRFENQSALSYFEETLFHLGLSGVGGKQSSGLGKFNFKKVSLPEKLYELLEDRDADYQMLLGTALPEEKELEEALSGGWYTLIRRGGFVRSEIYSEIQLKKRTIYMLSPGSCLRKRFNGSIFDISDGGNHPVWRYGMTLFAGVRL